MTSSTPAHTDPPLRCRPAGAAQRVTALLAIGLVTATASVLSSGCAVDVIVAFGECDHQGARFYSGDEFNSSDGCNVCRCEGSEVICTQEPCGCILELGSTDDGDGGGLFLAPGESVPAMDGCNICTCGPDGQVVCGDAPCDPCRDQPPTVCDPIPDCVSLGPLCTPTGWSCDYDCDPCDGPLPDCPEPPLGCAFSGPSCDGGSWTCGELYCDACVMSSPPQCTDPGIPGCTALPYCDGFGWYCIDVCTPQCDTPPEPCPVLGDGCEAIPQCGLAGWECASNCASLNECFYPPPLCDSPDPYCVGQPTCLDSQWYCEFVCSST